jgi:hypothetical protein
MLCAGRWVGMSANCLTGLFAPSAPTSRRAASWRLLGSVRTGHCERSGASSVSGSLPYSIDSTFVLSSNSIACPSFNCCNNAAVKLPFSHIVATTFGSLVSYLLLLAEKRDPGTSCANESSMPGV